MTAEIRTNSRADRIATALHAALQPTVLTVDEESALHAGHSGARSGGETHYRVATTSSRFSGLSRVERSRLVHAVLAEEFDTGLHALSLTLTAPSEE